MRTANDDLQAAFAGEPQFLKTKRAAELAQCHPKTLRKHVKAGTLEAVKAGKNLLIPRAALLRWLQKGIS
jgi:excisionase family DNA binding protein